jgi:subtilisin-like proprotein convertase family protein
MGLKGFLVACGALLAMAQGAAADTYTSTDVPKTIPDTAVTTSSLTIADSVVITDLDINLTLTHTFDGDLDILLRNIASNITILLSGNRGGGGNNFTNTTFDDEAATAIGSGSAPFSGTFRPEQALSAFDGLNAQGTWELIIDDQVALDSGELLSWSLIVSGTAAIPEPGALALLGAGLIGLAGVRRRRK